jgi:ATP citrate (pro-S)-lyase
MDMSEKVEKVLDPTGAVKSDAVPKCPPTLQSFDLFTSKSRAIIYGMQPQAVQQMLDFDFICKRDFPSVAAVVYPFTGNHFMKFYWHTREILIPIYENIDEAMKKFPEVDVVVNFASFRSVYETTMELLQFKQLRTIALIAEGVPERQTRLINKAANEKNVTIIGPATVGGIKVKQTRYRYTYSFIIVADDYEHLK